MFVGFVVDYIFFSLCFYVGGWVGGFENGRLLVVVGRDEKRVMGLWSLVAEGLFPENTPLIFLNVRSQSSIVC